MRCLATSSKWVTTLALASLLAGCANTLKIRDLAPELSGGQPVDLAVNLNLSQELCAFAPDLSMPGESPKNVAMGPMLCRNARIVAARAFRAVSVGTEEDEGQKMDAVLTPRVTLVSHTRPMYLFSEMEVAIDLEWELTDPTGQLVWVQTVSGVGHESLGNREECIENALLDLYRKSYGALVQSVEIRALAAL